MVRQSIKLGYEDASKKNQQEESSIYSNLKFIEQCPVDKIKPYKDNPRKNLKAVDYVVKSIEAHGFIAPIIINERYELCAGHTRVDSANKLNLKTIPAVMVIGLDGDKFKSYNIADNQTASIAEWDEEKLSALVFDLSESGWQNLDAIGFSDRELQRLIDSQRLGDQSGQDPDAVPTSAPKRAKLGDIWALGDHRLMCGDATNGDDVARLMDGHKADMVFTDPPYAVGFKYNRYNDNINKDAHEKFCNQWFPILKQHSDFIIITPGFDNEYIFMKMDNSFSICVWHKKFSVSASRVAFARVTEPLFILGKPPIRRYNTDYFEYGRDNEKDLNKKHPCPKPVDLVGALIAPQTYEWQIVLDVFIGSGTTIIACEQLKRRCYGMEIDPHYCDVAIQRWEDYTGEKAVKL